MNRLMFFLLFITFTTVAVSHNAPNHTHEDLIPIPEYKLPYESASGDSATKSINSFLATFDENEKENFMFSLDSKKRFEWSNLPAGIVDRAGISIGELSDLQRKLLFDFLASSLGKSGYEYVGGVMAAEAFLSNDKRATRLKWHPNNYWLTIFGTPSHENPWGWQFGGHHLAINMSIDNNKIISMSPTFIGTEPAIFTLKGIDYEVVIDMHHAGYTLFESLNSKQRKQADAKKVPKDILTGPNEDEIVPPKIGISASDLSSKQKKLLVETIDNWVSVQPAENADQRLNEIRSNLDLLSFAWIGSNEVSTPTYMRIQGPTVIIELLSTGGNVGENAEGQGHYHTIYRNPTSDYGGFFQ